MPATLSKPLPLHLRSPTNDYDNCDLRNREVAVHAAERLTCERLQQGLPAHSVTSGERHPEDEEVEGGYGDGEVIRSGAPAPIPPG